MIYYDATSCIIYNFFGLNCKNGLSQVYSSCLLTFSAKRKMVQFAFFCVRKEHMVKNLTEDSLKAIESGRLGSRDAFN